MFQSVNVMCDTSFSLGCENVSNRQTWGSYLLNIWIRRPYSYQLEGARFVHNAQRPAQQLWIFNTWFPGIPTELLASNQKTGLVCVPDSNTILLFLLYTLTTLNHIRTHYRTCHLYSSMLRLSIISWPTWIACPLWSAWDYEVSGSLWVCKGGQPFLCLHHEPRFSSTDIIDISVEILISIYALL